MPNSANRFKKNIKKAIESGAIKKIDLHRKTGISRPSIDGYLEGAVPDLEALDKIAEALNCDPCDLIRPEGEPSKKMIPIAEHLKALDAYIKAQDAAQAAVRQSKEIVQRHTIVLDPFIQKIRSITASLSDEDRRIILSYIESYLRGADAHAALVAARSPKKIG